jgi:hypothetical protein
MVFFQARSPRSKQPATLLAGPKKGIFHSFLMLWGIRTLSLVQGPSEEDEVGHGRSVWLHRDARTGR